VGTLHEDFADFYRRSKDECLMTVLVSVGDRGREVHVSVVRGSRYCPLS